MVSPEEGFFIVNWLDNSSDETGFRVYRKAFGGPYGLWAEFEADTTGFGDYDVEPGVFYTYYVVAFNAAGSRRGRTRWAGCWPGGA